MVPKKFKR